MPLAAPAPPRPPAASAADYERWWTGSVGDLFNEIIAWTGDQAGWRCHLINVGRSESPPPRNHQLHLLAPPGQSVTVAGTEERLIFDAGAPFPDTTLTDRDLAVAEVGVDWLPDPVGGVLSLVGGRWRWHGPFGADDRGRRWIFPEARTGGRPWNPDLIPEIYRSLHEAAEDEARTE